MVLLEQLRQISLYLSHFRLMVNQVTLEAFPMELFEQLRQISLYLSHFRLMVTQATMVTYLLPEFKLVFHHLYLFL